MQLRDVVSPQVVLLYHSGKSGNPRGKQISREVLVGVFPERGTRSLGAWCQGSWTGSAVGAGPQCSHQAPGHSEPVHISGKNTLNRWKRSTIFTVAGAANTETMTIDYVGQQQATGTGISRIRVSLRISFKRCIWRMRNSSPLWLERYLCGECGGMVLCPICSQSRTITLRAMQASHHNRMPAIQQLSVLL